MVYVTQKKRKQKKEKEEEKEDEIVVIIILGEREVRNREEARGRLWLGYTV